LSRDTWISPPGERSPGVQAVMQIAEEIIGKHRTVEVGTLYKAIKRRLKIPHKVIVDAIQLLLRRNYLVEGTCFSRETVLINPRRSQIFDLIENQRAVHFSRIKDEVFAGTDGKAGSSGQLVWHLEMLIKFKLIKKIKVKNYTVFIPHEMADAEGTVQFLAKDGITRKVLALLAAEGAVRKADVHKYVNEKREDVYYRINNLLGMTMIAESGTEGDICLDEGTKTTIKKVLETHGTGKEGKGGDIT
jgi:predicted transcriptional regulator